MNAEHSVVRVINGVRCRCRDTGCDDLARAEYNRYIIKNELFTIWWRRMEKAVAHTPLTEPLPSWVPLGKLPQVSKANWQQSGGGQEGRFEVIMLEVVET